jgi:hypothetical protein
MAEIKIEQKNLWPWLLVRLIIVGLLVHFWVFHGRERSFNQIPSLTKRIRPTRSKKTLTTP